MRIFRDLEMVEQLGSGVPRILKIYSKDCFVFGDSFTRMIFKFENFEKNLQKSSEETTQKTTQKIIDLIKENKNISRKELAEKIDNITEDGIKYHLNKLKKQGVLKRIGPDKGGYWKIIENKTN